MTVMYYRLMSTYIMLQLMQHFMTDMVRKLKGVANGDGTYSYSSGEKLYVDKAGTTAE